MDGPQTRLPTTAGEGRQSLAEGPRTGVGAVLGFLDVLGQHRPVRVLDGYGFRVVPPKPTIAASGQEASRSITLAA